MIESGEGAHEPLAPKLVEHGAIVRSVVTTDEALAALDASRPHVMLARIWPNAEETYALVREVRLRHDDDHPTLAVVAVGAPSESDVCAQAIESGFDECLSEPFDNVRLVEVLERTALQIKRSVELHTAAIANVRAQVDERHQTIARRRKLAEERSPMTERKREAAKRLKSAYALGSKPEPDNLIVGSLPADDLERITPHFELVALPQGRVLLEEGEPITAVYFLRSGLASRVVTMADGTTVEASVIGRDGMAGVQACLGAETAPFRIVMQIRGVGFRMPVAACREAFERRGAFQKAVLRYAASLDTQTAVLSACNRLHSAEQRLARWLLVAHAMADTNELPVTQELLSGVLGLRRVGVTLAAGALKKDKLVDYSWGQLRILRPAELEARACECYGRLKSQLAS